MNTLENSPADRPAVARRSPAQRPPVARRSDPQRSRITNGNALLPGVDQRSRWVRRCRDVIAAHLSDLGGEDNTSAAERSLVRRAAVLTTELEQLEVRFATAGEASADDLDLYSRASANLRRLLEAVGLRRRPCDVTLIDGTVEAPFSPMRARWQAEEAAAAAKVAAE